MFSLWNLPLTSRPMNRERTKYRFGFEPLMGAAFVSAWALAAPFGFAQQAAPASAAKETAAKDPGWPRVIDRDGIKLTCYQPQIDAWENYKKLQARLAFTIDPPDGDPAIGVVEMEGATTSNLDDRTVLIKDLHITQTRFPSLKDEDAKKYEAELKKAFPAKSLTVSLDRLIASAKVGRENLRPVEVKMDAPPIFVSTQPAMLLLVEGKPVLAPLEKTGLEFVVNTNWDLFYHKESGNYYLLTGDEWLASRKLDDGWTLADSLPAEFAKISDDETWKSVKESLPWQVKKGMIVPKVIFSDKPAELLSFNGDPVWRKIEGTSLMAATNTESDVFQDTKDQKFYFLVSGRWFRTNKLGDAWTYAGNDLPGDFARIPEEDPNGDVLASVPGTEQAEDAVLLACVPVEATVHKKEVEAKAAVTYNGDPQFKPIENTQVQYAVNTSSDVMLYQNNYYLCQDAVWFISSTPNGPWKVCTDVPEALYQLPPSSPVYRVTYVKVEDDDDQNDDTVVCSYTSGYFGAFVTGMALGEALVWGTGYYYPPYVAWGPYPAYYPYPVSYGVAAAYNPWTGGYAIGQGIYGPYASAGRAAWYNPATGRYGRAARVSGPYGARTVAAGYNPRMDTGFATRQGNNGFAQWGTSVVRHGDDWVRAGHINTADGGVARWHGSEGGGKFRWSDQGTSSVAYHDGDFYAGHDGNVYRKDQDGNWSKYENGNWQPMVKGDGNHPDARDRNLSGETRHTPEPGQRNLSGETLHQPGQQPGGAFPGYQGGGERTRPTDRIVDRQPQAGGLQPDGERIPQRPQIESDRRPQPQPQRMPDREPITRQLDQDSMARQRGDFSEQRQRYVQQNGGQQNFQRGSRSMGGGGFQGGGGMRGGGGFHGGGGFRRR